VDAQLRRVLGCTAADLLDDDDNPDRLDEESASWSPDSAPPMRASGRPWNVSPRRSCRKSPKSAKPLHKLRRSFAEMI
jgi:hypothetical protein